MHGLLGGRKELAELNGRSGRQARPGNRRQLKISSQPIVAELGMSSQPIAAELKISFQPIAGELKITSQPIAEELRISSQPIAAELKISSQPIAGELKISPQPIAAELRISSQPIAAELNGMTEAGVSENGPVMKERGEGHSTSEKPVVIPVRKGRFVVQPTDVAAGSKLAESSEKPGGSGTAENDEQKTSPTIQRDEVVACSSTMQWLATQGFGPRNQSVSDSRAIAIERKSVEEGWKFTTADSRHVLSDSGDLVGDSQPTASVSGTLAAASSRVAVHLSLVTGESRSVTKNSRQVGGDWPPSCPPRVEEVQRSMLCIAHQINQMNQCDKSHHLKAQTSACEHFNRLSKKMPFRTRASDAKQT